MRFKGLVLLAAWMFIAVCQPPAARVLAADPLSLLLSAPWHGSYVCNQGLTRMQLTLRPLPGNGGNRIAAEFVFSSDPDNPSVPTGSFSLTGTVNRNDRTLTLKQERWLEQPADPQLQDGGYGRAHFCRRFRGDDPRAHYHLRLPGLYCLAVFCSRCNREIEWTEYESG